MQENKKDCTYICVFIATILIIFLATIYIIYFDKIIKIPECVVFKNLGIYCPGCGATRAVYSLYNGDILKSIYYNPIIIYILIILFLYLITEGICKITKKGNKFIINDVSVYVYFGLVILLINWLIKLIMSFQGIKL